MTPVQKNYPSLFDSMFGQRKSLKEENSLFCNYCPTLAMAFFSWLLRLSMKLRAKKVAINRPLNGHQCKSEKHIEAGIKKLYH